MSFDLTRADTVCALATAPGPSALSVVRVSGRESDAILARVFRARSGRAPRPFVATLGVVVDPTDARSVVDECVCVRFPEGKSYTGEASFELSLHGGMSRARATLDALVAAGCRLAEPGEFTLRSVLTGKRDLLAAEAVVDVVHARTDAAARVAVRAVRGELGARIERARASLVSVLAELEARLDFPDEELGDASRASLSRTLDDARGVLAALVAGGRRGRRLVEGARVVLAGPPNAGKSTLFNALVDEERALVHETAGTTRDVLEGERAIAGVPVVFVDVAGLREGEALDPVERLGIARARSEIARADLVLALHDVTDPATPTPVEATDTPVIVVFTKADRRGETSRSIGDGVLVSAHTGFGVDALTDRIARALAVDFARDEALLTRQRQIDEVARAEDAVVRATFALDAGHAHEAVASELRAAGRALDRVVGKDLDEDVLDEIFRRFCIGK